jgi:hypothetical protein
MEAMNVRRLLISHQGQTSYRPVIQHTTDTGATPTASSRCVADRCHHVFIESNFDSALPRGSDSLQPVFLRSTRDALVRRLPSHKQCAIASPVQPGRHQHEIRRACPEGQFFSPKLSSVQAYKFTKALMSYPPVQLIRLTVGSRRT